MIINGSKKVPDEKIVNTQIKIVESKYTEFKEFIDKRNLTIQSAGLEAIEFWIEIQKYIGLIISLEGSDDQKDVILKELRNALNAWIANKRKSKFNDDPLFTELIGKFSADENLSKHHDKYYDLKD